MNDGSTERLRQFATQAINTDLSIQHRAVICMGLFVQSFRPYENSVIAKIAIKAIERSDELNFLEIEELGKFVLDLLPGELHP